MGQRKLESIQQANRPKKNIQKKKTRGNLIQSSKASNEKQKGQVFIERKTKNSRKKKNLGVKQAAEVSFKEVGIASKKGVSAPEKSLRQEKEKNSAKRKSRSHKSSYIQKKGPSKKKSKIKIGRLVIPIDKRFILTIIFCVLLSGITMLIISGIMRFRIIGVSDNLMAPVVEEHQQVAVDTQARIQRYDLVAFQLSSSEFSGEYIRRVVGLPGDSIWVENQTVFVNGSLEEMISLRPQTYASQLPSRTYSFTIDTQSVIEELQGFSNIPSESYLVLMDSSEDGGVDSRECGLINFRNIQGVVTYRLWPLSQLGDI
ncbi:signal peptidase I [Enterococcus sp. HY326]|uniref:signal peptidase I n=1 Tax=Enterococcus sp. HY326 TaxID=2971265 RepID=UPI002240CA66|nr:signal peptidase I [Enterococcus sp. HY326]